MEVNHILTVFTNIYVTIFALFCFKLLIKISLALLTHFYIVKGNQKEAARIAEEIYGVVPGNEYDFKSNQDSTLCRVPRHPYCISLGLSACRAFEMPISISALVDTKLRNRLYGDHICHYFQGGSWADRSPLHEAAYQGRLLSLKALIAQGFCANIITIDRITPLHEACLGGHVACAKVLLENRAKVNAVTIDGITPLFNACSIGSAACITVLLQYGAEAQMECHLTSPIHEAVRKGHKDCLEILVAHGVDIDQVVPYLGTPLYTACAFQQTECVRKLLVLGASVNTGRSMDSPLHAAARRNSAQIIHLLIDYGANTEAKNEDGKRPMELSTANSAVEKAFLLREGPAFLKQLCRLRIRKCLGRPRLHVISRLQLPKSLTEYLLYQ